MENIPFDINSIRMRDSFYIDSTFAKNHAHTLHRHHDVLELLYIYGGSGRYRIRNREYAVSEGDVVICNQGTLHGERLLLENTISTFCISLYGLHIPDLNENCLLPDSDRPVITLTRYKEMIHALMPMIHDLFTVQKRDEAIALHMAISVLMMVTSELQDRERTGNQKARIHTENLLRLITAYLDNNYADPSLRMDKICEQLHISESHLSHLFKKETGLSPKQYIVLSRVGEAQSLLEHTDMPIQEIETAAGFSSSVHLTATFRKYVGVSPREYRNKFRDEQKTGSQRGKKEP